MSSVNKIKDTLSKEDAEKIKIHMEHFDLVLGVMEYKKQDLTDEEKTLINQREKARKEKNFAESDKLRDLLLEKGIIVEDTKEGMHWKRK